MFKYMSVAEIASTLAMAEINFFNECSKWLNYLKIEKTKLAFADYAEIVSRFVITDNIHTRYAVLTGPELAVNLKDKGFEVFESNSFALKETIIIIATKNGYSWVGVMWFSVKLEETTQPVSIDI